MFQIFEILYFIKNYLEFWYTVDVSVTCSAAINSLDFHLDLVRFFDEE